MSKTGITLDGIAFGNANNTTHSNEQSIKQYQRQENTADSPFHAAIIGSFSGNLYKFNNQPNESAYSLKPKFIDRDNFDDVMSSLSPTLSISPVDSANNDESNLIITFNELEDFEPDALYDTLQIFSELRSLRRRVSNNATFEAAVNEINSWHNTDSIKIKEENKSDNANKPISVENGNFLDNLINATEERDKEKTPSHTHFAQSLIQQVVAPYIIPAADPRKEEFIAIVDAAISGLMNSILHHPDFQSLEASWRSLYLTVKKIRTDKNLKLFIIDSSKQNLINQSSNTELTSTTLYKKIIEPYTDIAGCKPWSLIIGDFYFNSTEEDIDLLEKLGLLAQKSNATFIAGAKPALVNCSNLGIAPDVDNWNSPQSEAQIKGWQQLRNSHQASHITLTFPRVLCRLPYGEKTRAIESFTFEEMPQSISHTAQHSHYLWGNAAYHVLYLLAASFSDAASSSPSNNGWEFSPGEKNEIENLPAHHYIFDGESELKACAEIYLTEKGSVRLLENGIIPVWSILRSDAIRIGPFSSLHSSNTRIQGRWK